MADHRAVGHRGAVRTVDVPARLTVDCKTCGAAVGNRCFRLSSWVEDPAHPQGGFYAERLDIPHKARRTRTKNRPVPVSDRAALRKEVSRLAQRKLNGSGRQAIRWWANSTRRTDEELAAKVEELTALPDLVPVTPLPHQRKG